MDAGTTAAVLAGGVTLAAYLNAKFHIGKDVKEIYNLLNGQRQYRKQDAKGLANTWFVFIEAAEKYPDMVCLWTRERLYTYRDVREQACQYAHYFLSKGVKKGDLVAFYLQNRAEFLIAWLGLLSIGCAPAAINYHLSDEALLHCLKISGSRILLVDEDATCRANIEKLQATLTGELGMVPEWLDDSLKAHIRTFPTTFPPKELAMGMKGDFPTLLLYTSGTTGLPKGCAFTTARFYTTLCMRGGLKDVGGPNGDRWYSCMPLYHGTAAMTLMATLATGRSIALGPKFSVRNFWQDIRDSHSTFFVYVGETARYLLSAPPSPDDKNHNIRAIYGNGLRPDIWARFQERFGIPSVYEFFNSSEGIFGLLNKSTGLFTTGAVGHHGAVMRAILNNTYVPVAIDPDTGDVLRDPKTGFAVRASYEQGGEIIVKIPNEEAFQGYWNNESATQKKYLRDVFKKGDLYYRSGDALRRQNDGRWYFLDRLGDTFRWKSENVATAEVAEVLGRFPGVSEANVYGVRLPNHEGRAGCAAIQISPEVRQTFDFAALARYARSKLPRYAVPVFLRLVDNPTHIHNHKQNKVPLRDEGVDPSLIGTKVPDGDVSQFLWLAPGKKDTRLMERRIGRKSPTGVPGCNPQTHSYRPYDNQY
ncbi:Isopenicillin N epimerase component 1 [Penicillium chermesinum]|uniref:Very long-chain fatty acid transport protein n=1 Tax=Penicillium chermesinum TaxID=63820 RepID=A0A9W9PKE8_9EURO|nr:Isopenicillin N epimerase component 1 [Penicillium chermesinum]KAJ5247697.1 Isopenicillin N epimerase component 1 [Penicillium chermesinum]